MCVFENNQYQIPKINEVVSLICNVGAGLESKKKEKASLIDKPSLRVNTTDQNSNLLYKDLEILVNLKRSLF